ncbi:hypothetical protein [Mumia sp. DW29H23]|uniref:hypothetical protein n=1 Tax=Mumia sp. DW29H23 TaxID=3421241 RepID=UPI003D68E6FD
MAFAQKTWQNLEAGGTPISAAELNRIEQGIEDNDNAIAGKANASHTHAQSDVTGLTTALAGKSNTGHTHATADVTGLDTALAGKSNTGHGHAQSEVIGLTSALGGKSDVGHTHSQADVSGLAMALDGRLAWVDVVTGDEPRPSATRVLWNGGATQPTNMALGDIWLSTGA